MGIEEKSIEIGHKARVGILGGSSKSFIATLLGVMSNGNVAIPIDVQSNIETLTDYVNRADIDYLFYDWEFKERVDCVSEACLGLKGTVCLQNRKSVLSVYEILKL